MSILLKLIKWIVIIVVLVIGIMFVFKLCPPPGPWMSPPWCVDNSFEAVEYETSFEAGNLSQIKSVDMSDTWGRNYNFNMIESTRNNIDSSFARLGNMGTEEVYVHDFHRAMYGEDSSFTSLDYTLEDEIFWNDMRDESMTKEDVENLVKAAHINNMKLGIKHNIAFVDIGKYMGLADIASSVNEDHADFNFGHTADWVNDFFDKWTARLVEKGKMYEAADVDIMSITPTWMGPTYKGQEELANARWKQLIADVKNVFSGELHVIVDRFGFKDGKNGEENWLTYDYYQLADIVELNFYNFEKEYNLSDNPSLEEMKVVWQKYLNDITRRSQKENFKLTLGTVIFSTENGINNGIIEFHDIVGNTIDYVRADWDAQAKAYQALFEVLEVDDSIGRIMVGGYWWDDAMDPKVKVKISFAPSIRNKPAEAVIEKWFINN